MLIIAIILFGMLIGAGAQLILGSGSQINWPLAFGTGLLGSLLGGLLISLLAGDGLRLRPSGILGSLAGALILTIAWQGWNRRSGATAK